MTHMELADWEDRLPPLTPPWKDNPDWEHPWKRPCMDFIPGSNDGMLCEHCGWREDQHD